MKLSSYQVPSGVWLENVSALTILTVVNMVVFYDLTQNGFDNVVVLILTPFFKRVNFKTSYSGFLARRNVASPVGLVTHASILLVWRLRWGLNPRIRRDRPACQPTASRSQVQTLIISNFSLKVNVQFDNSLIFHGSLCCSLQPEFFDRRGTVVSTLMQRQGSSGERRPELPNITDPVV